MTTDLSLSGTVVKGVRLCFLSNCGKFCTSGVQRTLDILMFELITVSSNLCVQFLPAHRRFVNPLTLTRATEDLDVTSLEEVGCDV